jgi:Domain of unknown function (DUF5666)
MTSFANFALGGLLLGSLVFAQAPSPAPASEATSSIIASGEESGVKPVRPSGTDASAENDPEIVADPASLIPDLPPVPKSKTTLIGGTVERMDRVRDQVTVRVFGGGPMKILFDPRTKVYRGKEEASFADLHVGGRIYLDTVLDGDTVFARSIRLKTDQAVGESQGVVVNYKSGNELTIRDALSPVPVHVRLASSTRFLRGDQAVAASTLSEGCLVSVRFGSEANGHDVAREISILALPGTGYTFAGRIVHLDLRSGLLVISSSTDHKTYELYLDSSIAPDENLHAGAAVTVVTNFEGSRYKVRSMTIDSPGK